MNFFGFHQSIFGYLSKEFKDFLKEHGNDPGAELFIPSVVDVLLKSGRVNVKVLPTHETWFGVTYKEDMEIARRSVRRLIEEQIYPKKLWEK